jgi:hypothetical protein
LTISCVLDGIIPIHYPTTQRDGFCQVKKLAVLRNI